MEYVNFYERIHNIKDLKIIANKICEHYNLGNLKEFKHIEIGYEDFNMLLFSDKGKYFVKMLNKSRPKDEQLRLVSILEKTIENKVRTPKILQINQKSIYELEINNKTLNIIVMEYIEGTNMLLLDRNLKKEEIISVAQEMAKINNIDYKVDAYYDEWTITNFEAEYHKKINEIDSENEKLITKVYNEMKNVDFSKFKKCFIHGDIIKSNLILDNDDKVWIIDFSVLNFLPRVIELAVAMFGICMTNDKSTSIANMNILIDEYNKHNKLEEYEIKNLPLIFNCISAMNVLQTAYIKNTDETFEENEHWLEEGRKGLNLDLTINDLEIIGGKN